MINHSPRDQPKTTDEILVDLLDLADEASQRGDCNFHYYNHYEDDGETIRYSSPYAPDSDVQSTNTNDTFSEIVGISTSTPITQQKEVMERFEAKHPMELTNLRNACLKAEYGMELSYGAVAINEIRARRKMGTSLLPLHANASRDQKIQLLAEVLGPKEFLSDGRQPDRPFQYSDNYQRLAEAEQKIMETSLGEKLSKHHQIAVAGSGPLPLTALLIHITTGARVACIDRHYHASRQQYELIEELERLGVVEKGAISVIHDNPASMDYKKYVDVEGGMKKIPDGLLVTYFARSEDRGNQIPALHNAKPLTDGIAYPNFNMPISKTLKQAAKAGISVANVRAASGTTQLLYTPVIEEDLQNTMPIAAFTPSNKFSDGVPETSEEGDVKQYELEGMHNSSIAVRLSDKVVATAKWSEAKDSAIIQKGYQGIITDEHFPAVEELESFEAKHFGDMYARRIP